MKKDKRDSKMYGGGMSKKGTKKYSKGGAARRR